jgi:hypothetical protein
VIEKAVWLKRRRRQTTLFIFVLTDFKLIGSFDTLAAAKAAVEASHKAREARDSRSFSEVPRTSRDHSGHPRTAEGCMT